MKNLICVLASLFVGVSCAKAPSKPLDTGKVQQAAATGSADAQGEHADHDDEMKEMNAEADVPAGSASARADDLELLKTWPKAQYVGNEQLQLSFLPNVPLN
jgi:hypothetical protein